MHFPIHLNDPIVFTANSNDRSGSYEAATGMTGMVTAITWSGDKIEYVTILDVSANAEHEFYVPVDKTIHDFMHVDTPEALYFRTMESNLRDAASRLEAQQVRNAEITQRHKADIARIGNDLIEVANDRDYCEEFDNFIDNLNRYLHVELPVREHEYVVTVQVMVHVPVTVKAKNEDDAYNEAENDVTTDEVIHTLRRDGWDSCEANRDSACRA